MTITITGTKEEMKGLFGSGMSSEVVSKMEIKLAEYFGGDPYDWRLLSALSPSGKCMFNKYSFEFERLTPSNHSQENSGENIHVND